MNASMESMSTRQRGVALVISLIILLVMTLLGVQGMQTVTMEEKMAGNYRERALAFEAAEAGLLEAESSLNTLTEPPTPDTSGTENVWTFGSVDFTDESAWDSAVPVTVSDLDGLDKHQYFIEERGTVSGGGSESPEVGSQSQSKFSGVSYAYRITVRGFSPSGNSTVYLQSNYVKGY